VQYLRSRLFDIVLVLWTLLLSPSFPVLWLLRAPPRYIRMVAHIWVTGILFALRHVVGLDFEERGRQNIPLEPCLIISNHQSLWETLAFAAIFPGAAFVAKQELGRIPIVGWFLEHYPMFMINRQSGRAAIRKMIAQSRIALANGRWVILFPEGTRKSVSDQIAFKKGVELVYSELQVPVLPVAVNSGVFWGPDRVMKYKGTITLSYLPVIPPGLPPQLFKKQAESLIEHEKERLVKGLHLDEWLNALG
jgi:1-acyl-sn-glycerol-3-phosphate acyltransferase